MITEKDIKEFCNQNSEEISLIKNLGKGEFWVGLNCGKIKELALFLVTENSWQLYSKNTEILVKFIANKKRNQQWQDFLTDSDIDAKRPV